MSNKITASRLRQIIQEELVKALVENPDPPAGGSDSFKLTSTSASANVGKQLGKSSTIATAAEKIKTDDPEQAAKGIADAIEKLFPTLKGPDLKAALQKLIQKIA